ncbi:MAG: class II fructose-bisphosphatase [Megasphaera sp.]|jgi:fructose-1,6-bisphosphatase II|nr:class II fructose-bisphosphatase [Megasphaera sp.]MCH4187118.1 class II fructose-bisphosphatase [Megasphaera sp.]MCH4216946.1 class II fructose-bisphosphatase [Megasphaera sp.]
MNRVLTLEFVRVTEAAAIKAGRLMGKGDKMGADQMAVDGMHSILKSVPIDGTVVIGEGEMDEAPMLYIGEHVGAGGTPVDIAVDPLEGTNLTAKGQDGSIAVMAIAGQGDLLHAPDMYMDKLCVGPRAKGCIDLNESVTENLRRIAEAMERGIDDLTVVILDRERHQDLMKECRNAGARIKLITDGDVSPAVDIGIEGSGVHVLMGIGGAPEGVLAAAALKCLGGDMQARLVPYTEEERKRCAAMGITDVNKVMTIDDLVKGDDCIFSATAITNTAMMPGIQYFGGGARTHSVVMRYKRGTIRFIDTFHRFRKEARWSIHL